MPPVPIGWTPELVWTIWKRKFLTLLWLELRFLSRPARSQFLYRLRYPAPKCMCERLYYHKKLNHLVKESTYDTCEYLSWMWPGGQYGTLQYHFHNIQYYERFQNTALKYVMLSPDYIRNMVNYKYNMRVKCFKLLYIPALITKYCYVPCYSMYEYFTLPSLHISYKKINSERNM
jgi:hypothetical protein